MTPEELEALLKLATWLGEDANPNETLLTDENARKIFVAAHSVKGLLEHIDSQADEIIQANHRYADLQNICDDQDKEIKRLGAERAVWIKHYQDNRKKHAALKKLGEMVRARGEALVEERADAIQQNPNRTWEMTRDQAIDRARKQLRAEGVIR